MENRVEILRNYIDELVRRDAPGQYWFVERHIFAVSNYAMMIALKRNLDQEVATICNAVRNHSNKSSIHDGYSELIKDADVFAHYFYNTSLPVENKEILRLERLLKEFKLMELRNNNCCQ